MKINVPTLFLILFLLFITQTFSQTTTKSVLRGQLQRANGKPLPYTEIELVPLGSNKIIINSNLIATSNSLGKFAFSNVPNGQYTLSINFDDKPTDLSPYSTFFYPSAQKRAEAKVFEISDKSVSQTIVFKLLPALIQRNITGKVILKTGVAVQGAYIFIRDVYFDKSFAIGNILSDKNGNFSVHGFEGRSYQIGAMLFLKDPKSPSYDFGKLLAATETDIFEVTSKPIDLNLVLGRDNGFERLPDKYIGQLILENETFQNP